MKASQKKTGWGSVAAWYDALLQGEGTYQKEVILPNVLRVLEPSGKKIIDIACGQGFFSYALAEAGAAVTGVDIAPELIDCARESLSKTRVSDKPRFEVAPAHKLPAKAGEFDGALVTLALQNIKELPETCGEAARVLKKGGELVIVLNHPVFRVPGASEWGYDEKKKLQYRRINRYALPFAAEIDMTPGEKNPKKKKKTISFHRSLQDYSKALTKAGFAITGIEEWHSHKKSQKGPRAFAEDTARKEFPLFLMLKARKN